MSLVQRASCAGQPVLVAHNEGLVQVLEVLRSHVSEIIPAIEAARLIARNPNQARSELRLACEQVLREEPWLIKKPFTSVDLIDRYLDEVFGLGPLEEMLADETITEIMVNGSNSLYFEREGKLELAAHPFGMTRRFMRS